MTDKLYYQVFQKRTPGLFWR